MAVAEFKKLEAGSIEEPEGWVRAKTDEDPSGFRRRPKGDKTKEYRAP